MQPLGLRIPSGPTGPLKTALGTTRLTSPSPAPSSTLADHWVGRSPARVDLPTEPASFKSPADFKTYVRAVVESHNRAHAGLKKDQQQLTALGAERASTGRPLAQQTGRTEADLAHHGEIVASANRRLTHLAAALNGSAHTIEVPALRWRVANNYDAVAEVRAALTQTGRSDIALAPTLSAQMWQRLKAVFG